MDAKWKFIGILCIALLVALFVPVNHVLADPPPDMHCPEGGNKFEGSEGSETIDGVTVSWSGHHVNVSGGSAQICVKASTQNSGQFWLEGDWDVDWLNPGGQVPDISYLVIYQVCPPTPEPTPTVPPIQFEWNVNSNCENVEIRLHNLSDVVLHVDGTIYAQESGGPVFTVASIEEDCSPDNWCGPTGSIGDFYSYFNGKVWGEATVSYQGEEIGNQELDETNLICGNPSTPTSTTPPPTPTATVPPGWNFEWDIKVNCIQPQIRVHNLDTNPGPVIVHGEIWAGELLVAKVKDEDSFTPIGAWNGPEGDLPQYYVGPLTGWTEIKSLEGVLIDHREISEQMNCASPTPTNTFPTPTQPAETPKPPSTPVPAPNTGIDTKDVLLPLATIATFVILAVAGLFSIVFRKR